MKINHDAKSVKDIFEGHELDEERLKQIYEELMSKDPTPIIGKKKSETIEYLRSIADDPEALVVVSMVLLKGLLAIHTLHKLKDATEAQMETMDLSDMPKELAEKILSSDDAPEELKQRIRKEAKCMQEKPQTEDVIDEFEKLKRKYS